MKFDFENRRAALHRGISDIALYAGQLDGVDGHAKREEEIQVEMEMGVAVVGKPPTPPPLLNGLRAGYPTVAPSSEIYAESWVNRPDQSAL